MGFTPQLQNKFIKIQCPLKFNTPENGTECITEKCAFWMPIQKACAINVIARIHGLMKGDGY